MEITEDYGDISPNKDPIGILTNIKTIMFQFQTSKYMPHAIHDCKRRLYLIRQDRDKTVPDYYKTIKTTFQLWIIMEEDLYMRKACRTSQ